jgi:predicted MFS family arabinose efflux permease
VAEQQAHPRATYGLALLTTVNLLNYLDRFIVAGVLALVLRDFQLTNAQGGLLTTVFIAVYMLAAPLAGVLGDRLPRRFLVAGSVFVWSLATLASGLAPSFAWLLVARAVVGVGEAGYGTVAPALISDLYPARQRTRALAFFYTAIPIGGALGFALGGWLGEAYSWRTAFVVGGLPGLLVALLTLRMPEPVRGGMEEGPVEPSVPVRAGLRALRRNRVFWFNTAGYTLMTFAVGGLGHWLPTYLTMERGLAVGSAGLASGAVTASAGVLGTLVGGLLGDRIERRARYGSMWLSAAGLLLAAPLMVAAVHMGTNAALFALVFLAQVLLFLNSGPINAALVTSVPPGSRALAMGLNTLLIHLLGDALSPPLIGWVADRSTYARAIELNAVPVLLGGLVLGVGAWRIVGRVRGPPAPAAPGR